MFWLEWLQIYLCFDVMRYCFSLGFFLLSFSVFSALTIVKLGNQRVEIRFWPGHQSAALVHLHENETTAYRVARAIQQEKQIGFLSLRHGGQRNIHFYLNHQRYEFDPNRMFSDKGIKNSLETYSHYSRKAHLEIKKLANAVLARLPKGAVIAVHNNRYYSMRDYLPGRGLSSDAKKLLHHSGSSWRNFLFMTQRETFEKLKSSRFNLVLQTDKLKDDGSLSVRLKGRPYVNVEAAYDQKGAQRQMILAAIKALQ